MLPSLLLVLWIYILIGTGSLSGTPRLSGVETALSHWSVGRVAGLVVASLAVALILHPLQLATTQLLEGYWGTSALAMVAMKLGLSTIANANVHCALKRLPVTMRGEMPAWACFATRSRSTDGGVIMRNCVFVLMRN